MIRKFIVVESDTAEFLWESFEVRTQIKQNVVLPFTIDEYRCIMFDGHTIHLRKNDSYIIGKLG